MALRLDKGSVSSVHYSPDGNKPVVAFDGGYVFLGDSSGKKQREWQLPGPTAGHQGVRFAPDGGHLVIANSNATAYILRLPR